MSSTTRYEIAQNDHKYNSVNVQRFASTNISGRPQGQQRTYVIKSDALICTRSCLSWVISLDDRGDNVSATKTFNVKWTRIIDCYSRNTRLPRWTMQWARKVSMSPYEFELSLSLFNANNVAERVRKMSIRFSLFVHTHNVLSLSWD